MNEVVHRLEMKEFTNDQIREIQEGIEEGLDVTVYAKKSFWQFRCRKYERVWMPECCERFLLVLKTDWMCQGMPIPNITGSR